MREDCALKIFPALLVFGLSCLTLSLPLPLQAQDLDPADAQALKETEAFLKDGKARGDYSKGNKDAAAVETFVTKFPPYAQEEMNAIVMMIMNESKAGSQKHVDAYAKGGAEAASASFSPAVKARIKALERRLTQDKSFNKPENLKMMKEMMPSFFGIAPR